ncbi:hypothetical protein Poly24_48240 [Rosistilla carotiformis]|uniref:Carboxypeptidase regulatory-like domain-containing protein n=1 Tax=Rosistilla carotiformis TaxID=2528017 RepID=A0A518JZW6_9BACT|nr:carboxypeptidase-like regulatory domain-containing protein [Rosistilla carotiformis]QDV71091.1 hypothetical protein Poly24_48240 [Rosistilla carotiformis]
MHAISHARYGLSLPVAILAICCLGCSEDGPELGAVTGTVTLDGQPLSGALVTLAPESGRSSSGRTDEAGHYELKFTFDRAGAHVGSHLVRITTAGNPESEARSEEKLPARYNSETELKAQVESGSNQLDFELTSGGAPPSKSKPAGVSSSRSSA